MLWIAQLALAAFTLPPLAAQDLSPRLFVAGPDGQWQPIGPRPVDGGLEVQLNASSAPGGRTRLLVNPPAGVDINDRTPPRVTGLKVDGKPKAPAAVLGLGRGDWQPRRLAIGVKDAESAVDEASVAFEIDGKRYPVWCGPVAREGDTYVLTVPDLDLGEHTVVFRAADTSPQANEISLTVTWERFITGNYCLASAGATLSADSHFENYPSLAPLQDGNTDLPGDHSQNDISWASAETPEPHWIEVDFGQVRRITRVIICWAYYGGTYHTSQRFEVQVPDGAEWRTVWAAPPEGLEPRKFTTIEWGFAITRRLRIYQPPGGGAPGRPDLMWLSEAMAR